MAFKIGNHEVEKRRKNIILGAIFSTVLAACLGYLNGVNASKYNDFLLGSVVFFLVFANIINAFRYIQWLKLIAKHRVEPAGDVIHFYKGDDKSTLKGDNIAKVTVKRKQEQPVTIFIELNIGNKIRLEGYDDMDGLLGALRHIIADENIGNGSN